MIELLPQSVFNSPADVITNTVNCEGVMGAGLALEFALLHPELEQDYVQRCQQGRVQIGRPYLQEVQGFPYRAVLNFPTKKSWRYPSQLDWIDQGLAYIASHYNRATPPIRSLALPQLGCDKGGLAFADVRQLVERHLASLPDLTVYLCLDSAPAEGREAAMLALYRADHAAGSLPAAIRGAARKALLQAEVPPRFRLLAALPRVGRQSYRCLFEHYCQQQQAMQAPQPPQANQLSLLG